MTREETLQRIEDLKKELNQLELTAYKYDNYVVMAIKIKGKETLQIHPKKQMQNLCQNGWRVADIKDIEEFKNYI